MCSTVISGQMADMTATLRATAQKLPARIKNHNTTLVAAGVAFYASPARYTHFVWHLCVLTGTSCHFFAVLWYT